MVSKLLVVRLDDIVVDTHFWFTDGIKYEKGMSTKYDRDID